MMELSANELSKFRHAAHRTALSQTIAALPIQCDNDREAVRRTKRDFNVSLQLSTVRKWRKRMLETGNVLKGKPPGRPRSSTDAETKGRILEVFDASPRKSTCQAARKLVLCYFLVIVI